MIAGLAVFPAFGFVSIASGYLAPSIAWSRPGPPAPELAVRSGETNHTRGVAAPSPRAGVLPLPPGRLPLSEVVAGPELLVLVGLFLVTLGAARVRQRILSFLDRRFFREQYDSQDILTGLVEAARWVDSAKDLAALITADVDRALHLQKVDLLVMAPGESSLRSPLSGEELHLRGGERPADHLSSGIVELTPRSRPAGDQPPSLDELDLAAKGGALTRRSSDQRAICLDCS